MKFTYKKNTNDNSHWLWCEKNKAPYISIEDLDAKYSRIFFDVTNFNIPLETVSNSLRKIYEAYLDFFLISNTHAYAALDDYYLFSLVVKKDHAEYAAERLFDYIKYHFIDPPR